MTSAFIREYVTGSPLTRLDPKGFYPYITVDATEIPRMISGPVSGWKTTEWSSASAQNKAVVGAGVAVVSYNVAATGAAFVTTEEAARNIGLAVAVAEGVVSWNCDVKSREKYKTYTSADWYGKYIKDLNWFSNADPSIHASDVKKIVNYKKRKCGVRKQFRVTCCGEVVGEWEDYWGPPCPPPDLRDPPKYSFNEEAFGDDSWVPGM